jgi:cholesterol oxidase
MGTLPLLWKLKQTSLPRLSETLGRGVRTNSESLIGVTSRDKVSFSEGIAIGSIVEIDGHRSLEPVKYSEGSGFWRIFMAPMVSGRTFLSRVVKSIVAFVKSPVDYLRAFFVDDWSKRTQILLYMESIDSSLSLKPGGLLGLRSTVDSGEPPTAFNPKAQEIALQVERHINGKAMVMATESLFGIPTTAHILGGACMGADASSGVIDKDHRVFNYQQMLICDGSVISANPGVNPSLTITALAERAMGKVERRE